MRSRSLTVRREPSLTLKYSSGTLPRPDERMSPSPARSELQWSPLSPSWPDHPRLYDLLTTLQTFSQLDGPFPLLVSGPLMESSALFCRLLLVSSDCRLLDRSSVLPSPHLPSHSWERTDMAGSTATKRKGAALPAARPSGAVKGKGRALPLAAAPPRKRAKLTANAVQKPSNRCASRMRCIGRGLADFRARGQARARPREQQRPRRQG